MHCHLMAASGLQELLEQIYAPNTVVHMLNGKAISRALRGHFLVNAALNGLIMANVFNVPIPLCTDDTSEGADTENPLEKSSSALEEAAELYEKLM